jgi:chorismate synthase
LLNPDVLAIKAKLPRAVLLYPAVLSLRAHEPTAVLRVPVVLEAVTAMALADLMLLEQRIKRIL